MFYNPSELLKRSSKVRATFMTLTATWFLEMRLLSVFLKMGRDASSGLKKTFVNEIF